MIVYAGMFVSFRGRKMTRYRERGFTLVELMIVIVVIGILAAIAAPNYQSFMAQRRLNGAARQIMSDLMAARMKAVSLNQKVKISFKNDHEYEIWNDANGDTAVADNEGDDIAKDINADYYDVTFSDTTNIFFHPRGTAVNFGNITVTNGAGSKTINVEISGRVKINS